MGLDELLVRHMGSGDNMAERMRDRFGLLFHQRVKQAFGTVVIRWDSDVREKFWKPLLSRATGDDMGANAIAASKACTCISFMICLTQ